MSFEGFKRNLITFSALALLSGAYLCSVLKPGWFMLLGSLLFLILLALPNRRNKMVLSVILVITVIVVGMLDYCIVSKKDSRLDSNTGSYTTVDCIVIGDPVKKNFYTQYDVRLKDSTEKAFLRVKGRVRYVYGNYIRAYGETQDIKGMRNPGDFDFRKYYQSKGFFKILEAERVELINAKRGSAAGFFLHASKNKVREVIYSALPEKEAALMYGIITGDKTDMDEESKVAYAKSGLSHILSVSGLHVGFLLILISWLLKPFKLGVKIESAVILTIVLYYVLIIGAPAPALRAFLMLSLVLFAKVFKRKSDLPTSISAAMIVILLLRPMSIHDPGFVISFCCMYSIAFLYEPVNRKLYFLPTALRSPLAVSLAVWLGITPVLVYYFNYVSVISIAANLAAIPLSFVITVMGFIGVLTGCVSHLVSIYIFSVCYYSLKILGLLTNTAVNLPFAGFYIPRLPLYLWMVYYLFLFQLAYAENTFYMAYRKRFLAVSLMLMICTIGIHIAPSQNLKLIFLDVGQGDSSCIITPWKKVMLIDGGGSTKIPGSTFDVGRDITVPVLLHIGVWEVDTVMVSHIHDDHIQGLLEVMQVFRVKKLILPETDFVSENLEKLLKLCSEKHVKVLYMMAGDKLKLGSNIHMDILWPEKELIRGTESDENNNSLVARLIYKKFSVLFTGDIQSEAEARLYGRSPKCDMLKVPHHGSTYSSTVDFVKAAAPKVSIIEVGKNNFGHPSEEAIARLGQVGSKVYRADKNGAVMVTTNGRKVWLRTVCSN